MVLGIGVDMVEISEIARFLGDKPGGSYEMHTFSERERAWARSHCEPAQTYAGMFAAKEATTKAISFLVEVPGYDPRWVELLHHDSGAPYIAVDGRMTDVFARAGVHSVLVSISNEAGFAVAMVLVQS